MTTYREVIKAHYESEADAQGLGSSSTMPDEIVRIRETDAIRASLRHIPVGKSINALEIGCGNGYLLEVIHAGFPSIRFWGIDYTQKMVELARSRRMERVGILRGDVCAMSFKDAVFDVVISERVIINLLDETDQELAFREVARVLKPGGWFICVEGFATPLANINEARAELMLPEIRQPHHNRWFTDEDWTRYLDNRFAVVSPLSIAEKDPPPEPNFLSTHYFVTRVVHDLLRPEGGAIRNTHFAEFLSSVLPNHGDYAPVKLYLLRRL
jgi:ubiquinone/menaquinone biosynthesis C-methylase UbiE